MERKKKRRNASEKADFIIETEMAVLKAIHRGHKCSDDDEFAEARNLVDKYRKDLATDKKIKK